MKWRIQRLRVIDVIIPPAGVAQVDQLLQVEHDIRIGGPKRNPDLGETLAQPDRIILHGNRIGCAPSAGVKGGMLASGHKLRLRESDRHAAAKEIDFDEVNSRLPAFLLLPKV